MPIKVFFPMQHRLHCPEQEIDEGLATPYLEVPERIDVSLKALGMIEGAVILPAAPAAEPDLVTVHSPELVSHLKSIAEGLRPGEVFHPNPFVDRCFADPSVPMTSGTFEAACHSAGCALDAAAAIITGDRLSVALCRPPGHHAGREFCGGYCYFNNAALAVQRLSGSGPTAVLDLDYHHGHGTQDIFHERQDVDYVSLHADPQHEYPFRWGFARERGKGAGLGRNLNLPLPRECDEDLYLEALGRGLEFIAGHRPRSLVVSVGFDGHLLDPFGGLGLYDGSYRSIGRAIAALGLPVVIVLEGGYNLEVLVKCWPQLIDGLVQE